MDFLTKEQILSSTPPYEDVAVPEWGGTVRIQALSAVARMAYIRAQFNADGKLNDPDRQDAVLAAFTIVDAKGERLFSVEDIEALAQQSSAAIARVAGVGARLCGFTQAAVKEAEKKLMRLPEVRFIFSLARELGQTVEELVTGQATGLGSVELTYWKALANLEALERHIG